jgi:hypothetical protein
VPNRILREGILTSQRVARLGGWAEEVFYRRLMSVVDDFGRYYAEHGLLRAACYPRQLSKVSDSDIGKWLTACVNAALVRVYPASDGESYLQVLDFGQQIRAKKSRFPEPLGTCAADATQTPANAHLGVSVSVSEDVSVSTTSNEVVPARPADEAAGSAGEASPKGIPDCPHLTILAIWAEVLPSLPRHEPAMWNGTRSDHMRARWREMAAIKGWRSQEEGLAYMRKFFGYVARSPFLMGQVKPRDGKRPFVLELEWLVAPGNWAKVHEGKYHSEEQAA